MILALQIGVLALTVLLWWRVQRDLAGRASAPPLAEWERLRQTVEQLTADLERRAVVAEQRVAAAEASLSALLGSALLEEQGESPPAQSSNNQGEQNLVHAPSELGAGALSSSPLPRAGSTPPDRFAQAERLIADGAADAVDIARQTGVSRGEAELLLSLRARRV